MMWMQTVETLKAWGDEILSQTLKPRRISVLQGRRFLSGLGPNMFSPPGSLFSYLSDTKGIYHRKGV